MLAWLVSFYNIGLDEFEASFEQDGSDDLKVIVANLSVLAEILSL